jgi:hypothetical protein
MYRLPLASTTVCRSSAHCRLSEMTFAASDRSYGLQCKLAKAPRYQEFPNSTNFLFGAHVHVDKLGIVEDNVDAGNELEPPLRRRNIRDFSRSTPVPSSTTIRTVLEELFTLDLLCRRLSHLLALHT